jgi:hypothetical protein
MPERFLLKTPRLNRRQLLKLGLAGIGVTGSALAVQQLVQQRRSPAMVKVPPIPRDAPADGKGISPMAVLRDFDYGTIKRENGRNIREFRLKQVLPRFSSTVLSLSSPGTITVVSQDRHYGQLRAIAFG